MQQLENGNVKETWKVDDKVITQKYNTSLFQCNCTFYRQNRCPCSHILFVRQTEGIALFDPTMYPKEYLSRREKKFLEDLPTLGSEEKKDNHFSTNMDVVDSDEESSESRKLTVSQKHNILFPKLQRLSNLICSYFGTEAFLQYVNEFDYIEKLVRKGQKIFSSNKSNEVIVDAVLEEQNIGNDHDLDKPHSTTTQDVVKTSNVEHSGYNLEFLDTVKSRGRPRGTGSGKTDFKLWSRPKSKTSKCGTKNKENNKTKNITCKKPKETCRHVATNELPDQLLLVYPPGPGEISVFTQDYTHLAPEQWVGDVVVDFYLSYVQHTLSENYRTRVLVLPALFYITLHRESKKEVFTQSTRWVKNHKLWRSGPKTVVLPVCRSGHWVTLVARLGNMPLMVVLNSISSGPNEPAEATILSKFLLSLRGWAGHSFKILCPDVPQQSNSYDCALFTMKYVEEVIMNPDKFVQMATKPGSPGLKNWFPYSEIRNKRRDLATLITRIATKQREHGGPLQGVPLNIPVINFDEVRFYTKIIICYIIRTYCQVINMISDCFSSGAG